MSKIIQAAATGKQMQCVIDNGTRAAVGQVQGQWSGATNWRVAAEQKCNAPGDVPP